MPPRLQLHQLRHAYGSREVLQPLDLSLEEGEVLGLLGPNGAGKSTLLRVMAGFERPSGGRLQYQGRPADAAGLRAHCAFLPDGIAPWLEHTAGEVMTLLAALHRVPDRAGHWIDRLDLHTLLKRPMGALSKGQRKRVLLAATLLQPKPIVLLDEPFDGLDLRQMRACSTLLQHEAAQGRSLVVCLHELAEAERTCQRFALLQEGHLIAVGTHAELESQAHTTGPLEEIFLALA